MAHRPHPVADRRVYAAFFWVTGVSYLTLGGLTLGGAGKEFPPGDLWWAAAYFAAGAGTIAAGVTAVKGVRGLRLWVRRVGLLLTPGLLIARGVTSAAVNGFDGLLRTVFLLWAAFVVLWASWLLRHLPTNADEYLALRREIDGLEDEIRKGHPGHH